MKKTMTTTAQDKLAKLERLINTLSRDGQSAADAAGDYEAAKSIAQTADLALELLFDARAELEAEVEELIAA
jgi:hypothetical protein